MLGRMSGDGSDTKAGAMVWCEPAQLSLAADVVVGAGLRVGRLGLAPRSGWAEVAGIESAGIAMPAVLSEAAGFDDLRRAVAQAEGMDALVVMCSSPSAARGDGLSPLDDPEFVAMVRERGMRLVTTEPCPGALGLVEDVEGAEKASPVRMVPLLAMSRLFDDARELMDQVGEVRTVVAHVRSAPVHGTLGARLFDAMVAVHGLLGVPDRVDCAVTGPASLAGRGSRMKEAGATGIRGLQGHATVHLRYAGGGSAMVAASNHSGAWFRGVTVLGDSGVLRLSDTEIALSSPTGEPLEEISHPPLADAATAGTASAAARSSKKRSSKKRGAKKGAEDGGLFGAERAAEGVKARVGDRVAALFSAEVRRALDPALGERKVPGRAEALAMCETAVLSSRTGSAEHTQSILNMRGKR